MQYMYCSVMGILLGNRSFLYLLFIYLYAKRLLSIWKTITSQRHSRWYKKSVATWWCVEVGLRVILRPYIYLIEGLAKTEMGIVFKCKWPNYRRDQILRRHYWHKKPCLAKYRAMFELSKKSFFKGQVYAAISHWMALLFVLTWSIINAQETIKII